MSLIPATTSINQLRTFMIRSHLHSTCCTPLSNSEWGSIGKEREKNEGVDGFDNGTYW